MSYITYGTSGLGAYYTSPVRIVPPSYSGFGAEAAPTFDLMSNKGIQEALNFLGASPPLTADGIIGPKSKAAIKAFQTSAGITVDGVIGPQTREAIAKAIADKLGAAKKTAGVLGGGKGVLYLGIGAVAIAALAVVANRKRGVRTAA